MTTSTTLGTNPHSTRIIKTLAFSLLALFYSAWLFIIPPLQMPDEGAHVIKGCANLVVDKLPRGYGHKFNGSFVDLSKQAQVNEVRKKLTPYSHEQFWAKPIPPSEKEYFYPHAVPNTATVYFLPHLVCRALNALDTNVQIVFYSMRVATLASFLALLVIAYKVNRRFMVSVSPLLMIPMVINQSVAIGADYFSMAAVILFGAVMSRPQAEGKPAPWLFAFSLFLMLNVKVVYLPLLILALPPVIKFRLYRSLEYIWKTLFLAIPALAMQYYYQTTKTLGAWTSSRTSDQLDLILHQPIDFFFVLINTLAKTGRHLSVSMFGNVGWLDTPMNSVLAILFPLSLLTYLVGMLYVFRSSIRRNLAAFSIGFGTLIFCIVLVFVSMYLFWSPPASPIIRGVQGRYFLPFLFFFVALIFQSHSQHETGAKPAGLVKLYTGLFFLNTALTTSYLYFDVLPRYY